LILNRQYQSLIFLCFFFLICSISLPSEQLHRILYISSYHPGFSTFFDQTDGLRDVFNDQNIILDIEFMDTKRFPLEVNRNQFRDRLQYKLTNSSPYDVVILGDDNALIFGIQEQSLLFEDTPLVFLGVNNIPRALEQNQNPQITGIVEAVSIKETIELMILQRPESRRIIALVDSTPSGQGDLETFLSFSGFFENYEFLSLDLSRLSWDEFSRSLRKIDNNSSILLLSAYFDKNEEAKLFEESLSLIIQSISEPVYHLWSHGLGEGILGGKIISHYEQGRNAALMALKIINGTAVSDIPVQDISPNEYIFDYQIMDKFEISKALVPDESRIINLPYSFYENNKREIWFVIITFFILILCILFLLLFLIQKHNIQKQILKSRKELQYFKDYLSNIIDNMPSVMMGIDDRNTIMMWNTKAAALSGVSVEEAKGNKLTEVYPSISDQLDNIETSIIDEKIHIERKIKQNGNSDTFQDLTIYPLIIEGFKGAVIRIDDVTEQVKMEEMIIQNEKMLSVGGLAAGMAHEINNPLAGILQSADVLNSRLCKKIQMPGNVKAAEEAGITIEGIEKFLKAREILRLITSITESGRRAAEIIKNMLNFARSDDTKTSTYNIPDLIDRTIEIISSDYNLNKHYDFKKILIFKDIEKDIPSVICESSKIQQVFLNLLKNGAEAMTEARTENPEFRIRINSQKQKGRICIEIEDNGPGMTEEVRKRVFEPFYTTKPVGIGTGLGLSIAYFIIVETHHGEMFVESIPGKGATFFITLPLI